MAKITINGDWFREKLTEKKRSQRQLAKHMELDPAAITLLFRGERRMQLEEARAIATFIGEPLVDVLRAAGLPLQPGVVESVATASPEKHEALRYLIEKRDALKSQVDALNKAIDVLKS